MRVPISAIVVYLSGFARLILVGLVLLLAQSFFWADNVPIVLKLGIGALGCLSAVHPQGALLLVAGITPLGRLLSTRLWPEAYPANVTEAIVLAFLAGWLVRSAHRTRGSRVASDPVWMPIGLLGMVIVASLLVHVAVLQVWKDYPWAFAQQLATFLGRDYLTIAIPDARPWVDGLSGFGVVASSALLLEGLGLYLCVVTVARDDHTFAQRLLRMVVAGAVGAALLSVVQVVTAAISTGHALESVPSLVGERWSLHVTKVNAAGSYFALVVFIALGALVARTGRRIMWLSAIVTIGVALWLTGSRAAILGSVATILATSAWIVASGYRSATVRRFGVVTLVAATLATGLVVKYSPFPIVDPDAMYDGLDSLRHRVLFAETSVRMLATRPLFGIGIGQYYLASTSFAPPELFSTLAGAPRANANNQFLQFAAELGLVGLVAFLWVIGMSVRRVLQGLRGSNRNPLLIGVLAGVAVFVLTCVTGQPLLTPAVAYSFWIVLGLAVVLGDQSQQEERHARTDQSRSGWLRFAVPIWPRLSRQVIVSIFALAILASVVPRMKREIGEIDLGRVAYGFQDWERDGTGTRFRWIGPRVRFHVSPETRSIEIPLRAMLVGSHRRFDVDILLNGRPADRIALEDDSWHTVRLVVPAAVGGRYRRVELRIRPTWRPAEMIAGSSDHRELGVQIGEVTSRARRSPAVVTTRPTSY